MSVLAVLAGSFSFLVRTEMKISSFRKASQHDYYAARAGLHRTAGIIRSHWDEPANGLASGWWQDETLYRNIPYEDSAYSIFNTSAALSSRPQQGGGDLLFYGLDDEESRLNINVATPEMLMMFDGITSVLAEEILIFRVKQQARQSAGPDRDTAEIICGPVHHIDELLQIKGMTRQILYGDGKQTGVLAENLTCCSSGRINVNTVKPAVLTALGFSDQEIHIILQYRKMSLDNILSIGQFFDDLSLDKKKHAKIRPLLTVKSSTFRFVCQAGLPGQRSKATILARLSMETDHMQFRQWDATPQKGVVQ